MRGCIIEGVERVFCIRHKNIFEAVSSSLKFDGSEDDLIWEHDNINYNEYDSDVIKEINDVDVTE